MENTIIRNNRIKCIVTPPSANGIVHVGVEVTNRESFLDAVSKFILYVSDFKNDEYTKNLDFKDKVELTVDYVNSFVRAIDDIPYNLDGVSNEVYEEIKKHRIDLYELLSKYPDTSVLGYSFNKETLDTLSTELVELDYSEVEENAFPVPNTGLKRLGITYSSFIALDSLSLVSKVFTYSDKWQEQAACNA